MIETARRRGQFFFEMLGNVVSQARYRGEAKSFGRNSIAFT
jgi:hypothetical protein